MPSEWYYSIDGAKHGPVSSRELADLARGGRLSPTTPVWREGMAEWKPAGRVKGLFPAALLLPPPQAPPGPPAGHPPTTPADDPPPGPVRYRSPRPAASRAMLVAGVLAGAVLLGSCLVCGLVGASRQVGDPKQAIVGTWEAERGGAIYVFAADGTANTSLPKVNKREEYTYTIVNDEKIRLVSKKSQYEMLSDKTKAVTDKYGGDFSGPFVLQSQYRFDGKDRLVILLGSPDGWPTRVGEAMHSDEIQLTGKGGGGVVQLRRKQP